MSAPFDFDSWQRRDQMADALVFAGLAIGAVVFCVVVGACVWLCVAVMG